jgi:dTDP-4-dehydrorhamnose reductase
MLGTELQAVLEQRRLPLIGTDREVDITSAAALEAFAEKQDPADPVKLIINCAAYTAVDKAEDDRDFCRSLNEDGPANIAQTARKIGAKLIHISTDYVFNGRGIPDAAGKIRPYREDDPTDPTGVYGLTKRDGENRILENNPASYIIRTAWLYGKHGNNFVFTMLRLMKERETITVVDDQRGTPTWAFDLANIIAEFVVRSSGVEAPPYGIYHYTNEGNISWYDFAGEIFRQGRAMGLLDKDCTVKPCTSDEYPAKVKRPAYSVLDKSKIKAGLGMDIPSWEESLGGFLKKCAP